MSVLGGELTLAAAARRHRVNGQTISIWRDKFVEAGSWALEEHQPGPPLSEMIDAERRLAEECNELKLALAEATVQLRIWQKGSAFVSKVPSPTSR